ncbi:MAG TPA: hypothetical protein VFA79_17690, partial [Myxococcales bacterium]|nr:hypothetical protein [Myxococcales bacterium]
MRGLLLCSIAVSLTSFASAAQVVGQGTGPSTQGAETPGQSFALQDDGTSLGGNPAGLGFLGGLELDFLHNGYLGTGPADANALYLTGGTGHLALGLGLDWLNNYTACTPAVSPAGPTPCSYRRTSVGGALRLGELSIGAVHRWFSGDSFLDSAWDFGALVRPVRWLSLGGAVLDATRPADLRRWVASAAVRPWREHIDLAVDLRWG